MRKLFTSLLILLLLAASAHAQNTEGIAGFLKAGYMHATSSGKIFSQVAPADIHGFDDNFSAFGAEAYYRNMTNIYTVEGTIGMQKCYYFGITHAEPYNGAAHGSWGRIIAENDHYWLYPSVGAGASIIQLTTYDRVGRKDDNIQEKTLVSPSFDAGINADFLLSKINKKEGYYLGRMLGIRAGYRASLSSNHWKDEQVIKPYYHPRYANNAFYITIAIGGGSFDMK